MSGFLSGARTFLVLWVGQVVSLFGSRLTGFALGVWVYQTTGSVTLFALISFFTMLPSVVLLPIAGVIADRFDRRAVMLLGDLGAALATAALAVLLWRDALELWQLYAALTVIAAASAPQQLAFDASVPLLVSRDQLDRANAFHQLGSGLAEIGAPLLAGALVVWMDLAGVLAIDLGTFLIAAFLLLLVRIPRPKPEAAAVAAAAGGEAGAEDAKAPGRLEGLLVGWRFIRRRPGLTALLGYYFSLNLSRSIVLVLITPLVLSFASPVRLGTVLSLGAAGMVAGGILMVIRGRSASRVRTIYRATALYSLTALVGGLRPNVVLIAAAAFLMLSTGPFLNSTVQALWQSKVPAAIQGQVFAARRMVTWAAVPLGYLIAGPLSDGLFEPWMAPGGALAPVLGPIFGVGEGRGVGVFLSLLGVAGFLTLAAGLASRSMRRVEEDLPDADLDAEAGPDAGPVDPGIETHTATAGEPGAA